VSIEAMGIYLIAGNEILGRLSGAEYKKLYPGAMPSFSAASIIESAMRSLTLCKGLKLASFA
jgi:hypothetical protein